MERQHERPARYAVGRAGIGAKKVAAGSGGYHWPSPNGAPRSRNYGQNGYHRRPIKGEYRPYAVGY